jgi:hypothetical protein
LEEIGRKLSMNTIAAYLEGGRKIAKILIYDILSIQMDLIPVPSEDEPNAGLD